MEEQVLADSLGFPVLVLVRAPTDAPARAGEREARGAPEVAAQAGSP